jgi:REP element-mobilizing transposase RayT
MPRGSRIDAIDAVHHIMVCGIERKKIFDGDAALDHFLHRMSEILLDIGTTCFAWSVMPNHFRLLLQLEKILISTATNGVSSTITFSPLSNLLKRNASALKPTRSIATRKHPIKKSWNQNIVNRTSLFSPNNLKT